MHRALAEAAASGRASSERGAEFCRIQVPSLNASVIVVNLLLIPGGNQPDYMTASSTYTGQA